MVHVLARHLPDFHTALKVIFTDGALSQIRTQQPVINHYAGKRLDCGLRRGWRAIAVRIILGQLLDQLLESGTDEVVAKVGREPRPRLRRVIADDELDISTARCKVSKMVLKKQVGIEDWGLLGE